MSVTLAPALRDRAELFALLSSWSERGWLRELDRALAQLFAELDPGASPLLLLGAALASHQLGQGHVCLDLAATLANPDFTLSLPPEGEDAQEALILPSQVLAGLSLESWLAACAGSSLLESEGAPLVLRKVRLP